MNDSIISQIILVIIIIIFLWYKNLPNYYATKNNNLVKKYIENANLKNPQHFITTVNAKNGNVLTNVIIADDGIHFLGETENASILPMDAVVYYDKDGDIHYTNQVYDTGWKITYILDQNFAISEPANLQNVTVVHDNTETYIYYRVQDKGGERIACIAINGLEIYKTLKLRFPYKEYKMMGNKI